MKGIRSRCSDDSERPGSTGTNCAAPASDERPASACWPTGSARPAGRARVSWTLLEPELGSICRHLVRWGADAEEAQSLTLSVAWEVVSGHRCRRRPGSPGALANAIWAEVRRDAGVRRGGATATVPLPEGFDVAGAEDEAIERWPGLLADAVAAGVITARQAVLVAETRLEDRPLGEVANALGRPYDAVRKERSRARATLRTFAPTYLSGVDRDRDRASRDAGDVLGVEMLGGVFHPTVQGAAVPLGPDRPGADQPGTRVVGSAAAARPRSLEGGGVVLGLEVVAGQADHAGGDDPGHLGVEVFGRDPLEAVVWRSSKGRPRTRARASVRSSMAASPPMASASRFRRRKVAQSSSTSSRR